MKNVLLLLSTVLIFIGCSTNNNGTVTVVPIAPTNLTGSVISTSQVNLSWTDNATNEDGYKIERKSGSGSYAVVGSMGVNLTTFSDLGLTPNTTYTYRVYAYNSAGNSLQYSNEVTVTTLTNSSNLCEVNIGNQYWRCKNLDVAHYRNGDIIPQITNSAQWANLTTGAWCWYNNDSATYGSIYGRLYNWYAVNDSRGLAPQGWHIPSDGEWNILVKYIDPNIDTLATEWQITNAGGSMKEMGTLHWLSPNAGATNSSNFTALPGGYRSITGSFDASVMNCAAWFWSSSENCLRHLNNIYSDVYRSTRDKKYGFSVRCIKD